MWVKKAATIIKGPRHLVHAPFSLLNSRRSYRSLTLQVQEQLLLLNYQILEPLCPTLTTILPQNRITNICMGFCMGLLFLVPTRFFKTIFAALVHGSQNRVFLHYYLSLSTSAHYCILGLSKSDYKHIALLHLGDWICTTIHYSVRVIVPAHCIL